MISAGLFSRGNEFRVVAQPFVERRYEDEGPHLLDEEISVVETLAASAIGSVVAG